jgi:type IV secretory pathway VirB2 component (pilin)
MTKNVVKMIAACLMGLSLTISLVLPATAVERPTTEVACQAAGMKWVQQKGKCKQVKERRLSVVEKVVGLIGLACAALGLALLFGSREGFRLAAPQFDL